MEAACRVFSASQADPALLSPRARQRPRKQKARLGMALLEEEEEEPVGAALWQDEGEGSDAAAAGGGRGAVAVPHYLYTSLISAFADQGAWAAALYLYEDFMLAHGPQALQRPLVTAAARALNPRYVPRNNPHPKTHID